MRAQGATPPHDSLRDTSSRARERSALLDEVVVTARRREERLQDVPLSITVLRAEQLEARGIEDVNTLQFASPNLAVTSQQTNRTAATIAMRGHVEMDGVPSVDPAVGLYIDGVYIARATGANLRLFDVERVEVLRGPQGTLFGRNTIGGAIQIVPREPAPRFEALVSGGAGNYGRRDVTGIVNLPQGDGNSALRLSVLHSQHAAQGLGAQALARLHASENGQPVDDAADHVPARCCHSTNARQPH